MKARQQFHFGCQATCCFLPIACSVLLLGLYNVLSSTGSVLLLFLHPHRMFIFTIPTLTLALFRASMGFLWGFSAITNVIMFKRSAVLARFTWIVNAAQLIPLLAIFVYCLTFAASPFFVPSSSTWGVVQAFCVWAYSWLSYLFFGYFPYSSTSTWLGILFFATIELLFIFVTLNLSWSYYNLLYYGASGWEYKAYDNLYAADEDEEYYDDIRRLI